MDVVAWELHIFKLYLKCFICYQPVSTLGFPSEVLQTLELQLSSLSLSKKSWEAFITSVLSLKLQDQTVVSSL